LSTKRICDLDGREIDPASDDFYIVTDARTGQTKDICMYCSRTKLNTPAWQPNTAYNSEGATVRPTAGHGNYILYLTETGTSGPTEPVWPTDDSDLFELINDGTAWWMVLPTFRDAVRVDRQMPGTTLVRTTLWGWMYNTNEPTEPSGSVGQAQRAVTATLTATVAP
jgi:hypothetical protein